MKEQLCSLASNHMFEVNHVLGTRSLCWMSSRLTVQTPEWHQLTFSRFFFVWTHWANASSVFFFHFWAWVDAKLQFSVTFEEKMFHIKMWLTWYRRMFVWFGCFYYLQKPLLSERLFCICQKGHWEFYIDRCDMH